MRSLGDDFGRLWTAYAISAAGSTIGAGALGVVAVLALDASAWQVSMLTAVGAGASALLALPFGSWIEYGRKRPAMIAADLTRCVTLAGVPVAAALHVLTLAQLYVVSVVQSTAFVAFAAAGGAHLKALVAPADRVAATSRLESTDWLCWSVGTPLGGVLIGVFGATTTMLVDAVSFLGSALGVRSIRRPEPPPPVPETPRRRDLGAGWRYLLAHPVLRPLFFNAMLFGGGVLLVSPLETVLMLRDLGFAPWEYGLVLGLPCLGGAIGARLAPRLQARFGVDRVLRYGGILRAPWLLAIPFAGPGPAGLFLLLVANFGLLLVAGIVNPAFAAYRLDVTPDGVLARVITAWSISSRSVKPLFIAAGGALAAITDVRTAIGVGGAVTLLSVLLLPRGKRERNDHPDEVLAPHLRQPSNTTVPVTRASENSGTAG